MDKQKAAERIRKLLEGRVARVIGCEPADLPHMKIGSMAHFLFLIQGDGQTMPGFETAMSALGILIGFELIWDLPEKDKRQAEEEKPQVIN